MGFNSAFKGLKKTISVLVAINVW